MAKTYVVRIVQTELDRERDFLDRVFDNPPVITHSFIESLRYAGLIDVHEVDPNGLTTDCFDLICPNLRGRDYVEQSKIWAEQNAERMRTFGFNAVCAPSTR